MYTLQMSKSAHTSALKTITTFSKKGNKYANKQPTTAHTASSDEDATQPMSPEAPTQATTTTSKAPHSPPTPTTEEAERHKDKKAAQPKKKTKRQAADKERQALLKEREKKCVYRPKKYEIREGAVRGTIDRRKFFESVTLITTDESGTEKAVDLKEGARVREFVRNQDLTVELIYRTNNGPRLQMYATNPADPTGPPIELSLDSITEINTPKDYNMSTTHFYFARLET